MTLLFDKAVTNAVHNRANRLFVEQHLVEVNTDIRIIKVCHINVITSTVQ